MIIQFSHLIDIMSKWYNAVWIISLSLSLLESIAFHTWLSKSLKPYGTSYFRGIALTMKEAWLDYLVLFFWFLLVCIASYPTGMAEKRQDISNVSNLLFGAVQAVVVSHFVLRYVCQRSISLHYARDLLTTLLLSSALYVVFLIEVFIAGMRPENVSWLFIGVLSYFLVVDVGLRSPSGAPSLRKMVAMKDGALIFVILTLAVSLFPHVEAMNGDRLLIVAMTAIIIGIITIYADWKSVENAMNIDNIKDLASKAYGDPNPDGGILESIYSSHYCHILVRDVALLMCGVVLAFAMAAIRTLLS